MFRNIILYIFILLIAASYCIGNNIELPVFKIYIDDDFLEKLNSDPLSNEYFPAKIEIYGKIYNCDVRYRGGTARNLPKKSWRIRFNSSDNIFGADHINLNSEYRDSSAMRNYLAIRLFKYYGQPAPEINYINLEVNNQQNGVYQCLENVDEKFLTDHFGKSGILFKASNHGACLAPLTDYEMYKSTWEIKSGDPDDYRQLQEFTNQLLYCSDEEFESNILHKINIDNVLRYFAIEFSLVSMDCFSVNYFLYHDIKDDLYSLIPWDNDASFGNDWEGVYQDNFAEVGNIYALNTNLLFRRLIEKQERLNNFKLKFRAVVTNGFNYLKNIVDSLKEEIEDDIFKDDLRAGNFDSFARSVETLKSFLIRRHEYLEEFDYPAPVRITDFRCSAINGGDEDTITFRAKTGINQKMQIYLLHGIQFDKFNSPTEFNYYEMYDDGLNNDSNKNDGIYGIKFNRKELPEELFLVSFNNGYNYPENGLWAAATFRTKMLAVDNRRKEFTLSNLKFTDIFISDSVKYFYLENKSSDTVDLSYCHIQIGPDYDDLLIPEFTVIPPKNSICISQDKHISEFLTGNKCIGNIFFDFNQNDKVRLLDAFRQEIINYTFKKITFIPYPEIKLCINEINYNSPKALDPGDWIEIYNYGDSEIDLTGWRFSDNNNSHNFIFPDETLIKPDSFLVLCRYISDFSKVYPDILNKIGNFKFGLNSSGDNLRLYNSNDMLVDKVNYSDKSPWPESADGRGPTLELTDPESDNNDPKNWHASLNMGTPGNKNSYVPNDSIRGRFNSITPNPFSDFIYIEFEIGNFANVNLSFYDINGKLIKTIVNSYHEPGIFRRKIYLQNQGMGLYLACLRYNSKMTDTKIIFKSE